MNSRTENGRGGGRKNLLAPCAVGPATKGGQNFEASSSFSPIRCRPMGPPQHPVIAFSDLLKNACCNLFGAFLASSDRVISTVERTYFFRFPIPDILEFDGRPSSPRIRPLLFLLVCFLRVDG